MGETMILTDFGTAGRVTVSQEDYDAEHPHSWRLDSYGYVVRSGSGKGRVTLARSVAQRAGLGDGQVSYRDGDHLNCTRGNLFVKRAGTLRVLPGGPGRNHAGHLHPPGVHRYRVTGGPDLGGPPPGWVMTYHTCPCRFPASGKPCCQEAGSAASVMIGSAVRLPLLNRVSTRWLFSCPTGWRLVDGGRFYDGCEFLRQEYLKSLVPACENPAQLALMRQLLGITRQAAA